MGKNVKVVGVNVTDKNSQKSLDNLIKYVTLHENHPVALTGIVLPFVALYLIAFYIWYYIYGVEDYYEAGIICIVVLVFIHVLTCLSCYWSVHVLTALCCRTVKRPRANTLAKVVPTENNGSSQIVRILRTISDDDKSEKEYYFLFQKTKYVWDSEKKTFKGIEFPINLQIKEYLKSKGYETDEAKNKVERKYGKNTMEMVVPEFIELFIEKATAPFFVFQVFSVLLWCLDEYWYYSLFTLGMLIMFEWTMVHQTLQNMSEIRKMGNKPYMINVLRNNKWRPMISDEVVPGDLISIVRSQNENLVPCDVVILRGLCIVDESMLTGESVPLMKECLESSDNFERELDPEGDDKLFVLFGGTKVVQHTSPSKEGIRAPDGGCVCYVLRNGFQTSQGKLLRTILFGVKRVTENNLETFAFILFLLIFAIAAAVYVWIKGTEDPERNRYKLFLECTLILTSIIPPDLPIELSLAVNTALLQLSRLYVYCTEPFRIPFAGKTQICCFDKTGTLTSDDLMVEGVAGVNNSSSITPISEAPENTIQVLASCHSLAQLDDGLVGDPLEKATLTAVDWNLTKQDSLIPKKGKFKSMKIYTRFYFSSALKRMSVLAGYMQQFSNEVHYIGTVKGAPEVIQKMLKEVPDNYEKMYLEYSRRGARVLALGIKEFGKLDNNKVREIKREDVEKDLTFAGFVIISCPMKPDSKSVIKELINSSHKVVMITGDNPLTACHVATELRFTRKKLLVLTENKSSQKWNWQSIDQSIEQSTVGDFKKLIKEFDLCITGEGLQYLRDQDHDYMLKVLPKITVCARFAPKQKEFVITTLKRLGYFTLMCGDGTNDVGALKHAHVGVSILSNAPLKPKKVERPSVTNAVADQRAQPENLTPRELAMRQHRERMNKTKANLEKMMKEMEDDQVKIVKLGDASIAAPFTSKLSSITCVNNIIKQGRCTLVTTLQMFKILALNALISAYCQSVLYIDGIKFSDSQATLQGIFLAACFLLITRSKALKTLSKTTPLPNIFNLYSVTSILLQFAVHFSALVYLAHEANIRSEPRVGKVKLNIDLGPDEKDEFKPNIVNSTVYIICMALQVSTIVVNYKGHPFKESLRENKYLMYAIAATATLVVMLALGLSPDLTATFEIIDFPEDFTKILMNVLVADFVLALLSDRICSFLFGERRQKSILDS